jgi:hypothetical protein
MVTGPTRLGEALGEAAGAGAEAVAVFDVITNELYCLRPSL